MAVTCRQQHNKQDTRQLCFDVPHPLPKCSEFVGYLYILDLNNAQNMEHIKILSLNLPGGTWETKKTTANTQTVVDAHYSIILHKHLFPHCTT